MNENDLVTIYEPGSDAEFMIVSSLLNEQGIPFLQKNQHVQNLFGHGAAQYGFNPLTGPIKIQVKQKDYEDALHIINHYKSRLKNNQLDADDLELNLNRDYKQAIFYSIVLGLVIPASGIFLLYKALKLNSNPQISPKSKFSLVISTIINLSGLFFWHLIFKNYFF